jgi:hypothetical protein
VSLLSFILPPWIHLRLISEPALEKELRKQRHRQEQEQLHLRETSVPDRTSTHSYQYNALAEEDDGNDDPEVVVILLESDGTPLNQLNPRSSVLSILSGSTLSPRGRYNMDVCLLIAGVLMCLASTYVSILDIYGKLEVGKC